jgi:hypothetical protein
VNKTVIFHPDDIAGRLHEAKALAAAYGFSVKVSPACPKGQMLVLDLTESSVWRTYDESRRGRDLPGFRLGDSSGT